VRFDDGPQPVQEFFGFPPPTSVGDPGRRRAEVLLGVGDVWSGQLTKPFQIPLDRLESPQMVLAVVA
jgi:hypothetical protein